MAINPAPFHLAQTIVVGLCVALSIATLGTSAHTLDVYNKQKSTNPWWLFLWPEHYDVHGTQALVGASVSTLVLSTVFLVFTLVPRVGLFSAHVTPNANEGLVHAHANNPRSSRARNHIAHAPCYLRHRHLLPHP